MARNNSRKTRSSSSVNVQDREATTSGGPNSSNSEVSPVPISDVPPPTLMASTSSANQNQRNSSQTRATKRKRGKCPITDTWSISFGLFEHHERGQNYFLIATHENEKNKESTYHVSLVKIEEKWNVNVKKLSLQCSSSTPILKVLGAPVQPQYNFSLQKRLQGWIVKKTRRNGKKKAWDKCYIYENKLHFRSMVEVAIFVLYNCRRDHLENAKEIPHEEQEQENPEEGQEQENPKDVDDDPDGIYTWVLANPIINLDELRLSS